MRNNWRTGWLWMILIIPLSGLAQHSVIEKTRAQLYAATTDEERLKGLVAMCRFRNSLSGDSIYQYAIRAKELALRFHDNKSLAFANYSLISSDLAKGKTDSVIYKIDHDPLFKGIKKTDTALYYKIQLLKANALNRINDRSAALELQLKLLTEAEQEGNVYAELFALNFIGATYLNVDKPAAAEQAWQRGLQLIAANNKEEYREIQAYMLSNLALYYFNNYYIRRSKEWSDSFLVTINQTIEVASQHEALSVLASAFALRGNYYGETRQFDAGEKDIRQGLAIRKMIGDPLYVVNDLATLANFYLNQQQYGKCIEVAQEGISLADSNGIKEEKPELLAIMGKACKASGDYRQYSTVLEKYIAAADSNYRMNAAEKIAAVETKYEVQKKETLIAQQRLSLFQRKLLLFGGAIAVLLLFMFVAYRFRQYQRREKIKLASMMEEEKRQQEQAVKEAEDKERKRIAAELHDNLGVQANAILHNSSLLSTVAPDDQQLVKGLQETAKEMLLNLRETLWALKVSDVPAAELWLRIISFMQQMGRNYTAIQFKTEGESPGNAMLSSARALNIILVLQETVNNAVKHAAADTIIVKSIKHDHEWIIHITDNGKGFDLDEAKAKTDSYGLTNMKERAAAGGFLYEINTTEGKGTEARIIIQ